MKRFGWFGLILAAVWTSCGTGVSGQLAAPELEAKLLARAALKAGELMRTCSVKPEKSEGEGDEEKAAKVNSDEIAFAEKLSLPLLFRQGRFIVTRDAEAERNVGSEVVILHYVPRAKGDRLKPAEGEDSDVNKVMNHLSGFVYLDPATQSITFVHGELTESLWLMPKVYKPLLLTKLTFDYHQILQPRRWVPDKLLADAKGYVVPKHYKLRFDCGQ